MPTGVLVRLGRSCGRVSAADGRATAAVHLVAALTLVLGLLIPLFNATSPVSAATGGPRLAQSPRGGAATVPAPTSATASGSFGPDTPLRRDDDNVWRGTVPVSAGSYTYRINVETATGSYSLGSNADPGGNDLSVDASGDQTGIAFNYDPSTATITAVAYTTLRSLNVADYGTIDLSPTNDTTPNWDAWIDGPGGSYDYTVQSGGHDTDQTGTVDLPSGRLHVILDTRTGNVSVETVQPGTLQIATTDSQNGSPVSGGCYAVYDGQHLLGQACDGDDGSEDGQTTIGFPDGAPNGSGFGLTETVTPDGAQAADDKQIRLGPGLNTATMYPQGGANTSNPGSPSEAASASDEASAAESSASSGPSGTSEASPSTAAGTSTAEITTVDSAKGDKSSPLPGACYRLTGPTDTHEVCDGDDGDNDGVTTFNDLANGTYSLTNTTAPDGYDPYPDGQTFIVNGLSTITVPVNANGQGASASTSTSASVSPSESASASASGNGGTLEVRVIDADGNPLTGAAVGVSNDTGGYGPFTDGGDGSTDGVITVTDVYSGANTVSMTTAPDGYDTLPDQTIDVSDGETVQVTFDYGEVTASSSESATESPRVTESPSASGSSDATATLTIETVDANGDPLGGAAYTLIVGDQQYGPYGDDDGDGQLAFDRVGAGDFAVSMDTPPSGYDLLPDQDVTMRAGQDQTVIFSYGDQASASESASASETASPSASPSASASADGRIVVTVSDGQGKAVGGSCFSLLDPNSGQPVTVLNRDNGDPATEVCDSDGDVPGDGRIGIFGIPDGTYDLSQTATADGYTAPDDQSVTVLNGNSQNIAITDQPAAKETVTITRVNDANDPVGGACFQLEPNRGDAIGPVCDDKNGDQTGGQPGVITIQDVPVGTYTVHESTTPDGIEPADDQQLQVTGGGDNSLTVKSKRIVTYGQITVQFTAADGPAGGGCVNVANQFGSFGPFCDNQFDAANDGTLTIPQVESGKNTVTIGTIPAGYRLADGQDDATDVTVKENQTATVTFQVMRDTGSVEVSLTDAATGLPVTGFCAQLRGADGTDFGDPRCDGVTTDGGGDQNPDDGTVGIEAVPVGDYSVVLSKLPDGYTGGNDAGRVTVTSGQPAQVSVEVTSPATATATNSPTATATATAIETAPATATNSPTVTATATATATPTRKPTATFTSPNAPTATVTATNSPTPTSTATATTSPSTSPSRSVRPTSTATEPASLPSPSETPVPSGNGSLVVRVQDQQGNPLEGVCLVLTDSDGQQVARACDNGDADTESAAGIVGFSDIPAGQYQVSQDGALPSGLGVASSNGPATVTVVVGVDNVVQVLLIISVQPPADRTVSVVVFYANAGGTPLPGGCFTLDGTEVCDNGDNDTNGAVGQIQFDNVGVGSHTVAQTQAAKGYQVAADQQVTVDETTSPLDRVSVVGTAVPDQNGALTITKVDENGDRLKGACFTVTNNATGNAQRTCDLDDGSADGTISFSDLTPATYTLNEVSTPAGYATGGKRQVTILAGQTAKVTVTDTARVGRVVFAVQDSDGNPLTGACFRVSGPRDFTACDGDDVLGADGETRFISLPPGDYTVVQTVAPPSYQAASVDPVRVAPGGGQRIVVTDAKAPPPDNAGNLTIAKVDNNGQSLAGACFTLRDGSRTVAGPVCDGEDGQSDGQITMTDVAAGTYTLHETRTPSAAYAPADDSSVTITAGETATARVVNTPRNGAMRIRVINRQGQPLSGACFDLGDDGKDPACTDSTGTTTISDVAPGTYTVTQTDAPDGYDRADPRTGVQVNPGVTTSLTFTLNRTAPPPNTGTLQLSTFYCVAGSGGEQTVIYDSSNAGPKQLARTAGCSVGNATYSFVGDGGEGGIGTFSVGDDGFYQATVPAATYTLTETSPVLGQGASEQVDIRVNQLTQVIVINFVAPAKPAPASVDVTAYTCPAGLQGTIYGDFYTNCTSDGSLTNGIAYRLSGPSTIRGTTGSGGDTGHLVFGDLPTGSYTLSQQLASSQQVVYSYCGLDLKHLSQNPVGTDASFVAGAGQTIYCQYFNVPAVVSDNTGAITIQKYTCPVLNPPANYDYYGNCSTQAKPADFTIAIYNGETKKYDPVTDGSTDANGVLTFNRLTSGTYRLREQGSGWCYAESDSVNTNGDVVVRRNEASKVFIFNCSPVVAQPNTGSGTMSALSGGTSAPWLLAIGSLVSLIVAAAWVARQRRMTW